MLRSLLNARTSQNQHEVHGADTRTSDRARLLNCLLDELRASLVLAGVTTSTLNAFARNPKLLNWIGSFVPADPIIFPNVNADLIDGVDSRKLQYTTQFYRHLRLAKVSLTTLVGNPDVRAYKEVVDTWRSVCGLADAAIKETDRYFLYDKSEELHLSDDIRRLLIAVRAGQSPCLINGRPEMPSWFQRRHQPRIAANLMAQLIYGSMTASVLIVNISVGGCGLEQAPPLPPDAIIYLRLESGRILESVVRWQNGDRVGLLFSSPLGYRDPLISAG
jgi:hypothetical protein